MRRNKNLLYERLIDREIKRLIIERGGYASNSLLSLMRNIKSFLNGLDGGNPVLRAFSTVGLNKADAIKACDKMESEINNGNLTLDKLDEAARSTGNAIAQVYAGALSQFNTTGVNNFKRSNSTAVKQKLEQSNCPQTIQTIVLKVHYLLQHPNEIRANQAIGTVTGYVNKAKDWLSGAWDKTKEVAGNAGNAIANGARSGYNTVKGWLGH